MRNLTLTPLFTLVIHISADITAGAVIIHPKYRQAVDLEPKYAAERRASGTCSNSKKHGKAVVGGRCQMCWDRKRTAELAKLSAARAAA